MICPMKNKIFHQDKTFLLPLNRWIEKWSFWAFFHSKDRKISTKTLLNLGETQVLSVSAVLLMEENPKANHLGCLKPLQNNVRKTTFHLSAGFPDFWTINSIICEVNDASLPKITSKGSRNTLPIPRIWQLIWWNDSHISPTSTQPDLNHQLNQPGASTPAPLRSIRFIIISFRLKLFSDGTRTLQNQGHQNVPWVHTGVITGISSGFF